MKKLLESLGRASTASDFRLRRLATRARRGIQILLDHINENDMDLKEQANGTYAKCKNCATETVLMVVDLGEPGHLELHGLCEQCIGSAFTHLNARVRRPDSKVVEGSRETVAKALLAVRRALDQTHCRQACEYDEAEGDLMDHCRECCYKIVCELCRLLQDDDVFAALRAELQKVPK